MATVPDRRRVNGPSGGSVPLIFNSNLIEATAAAASRTRLPREVRKIFLKTGLTPSASGSAYLELQNPMSNAATTRSRQPSLKLTCTVHGPKPLPRSAPFSSQLILSTRVKFAPFATGHRKSYIPDPSERDLAAHLETALRGVLLSERWPKSGVDVVVTVLEDEQQAPGLQETSATQTLIMMNILSGCITVASAAVADAGIDCVDVVTGGVAAVLAHSGDVSSYVIDPCPSESQMALAACVVAYLESKDEVTEVWSRKNETVFHDSGNSHISVETLVDNAVEAACAARSVVLKVLEEAVGARVKRDELLKNRGSL